jgi:hypothetical protein
MPQTTIKEILDSLKDEDRRLLMYAFQHELGQFVRLDDGRYVGVNVKSFKQLRMEMETGVWSYGVILDEDHSVRAQTEGW